MLNQKYEKQLEEIKEFNSKSNFDSQLTSDNVIMPTDSYKRPKHVRFEVSTVSPSIDGVTTTENNYGYESCDIRLTTVTRDPSSNSTSPIIKVKPQHDVFLYRMGYFNYQKLNMQNMVMRYKGEQWYTVDILINWANDQSVTIFIDGE